MNKTVEIPHETLDDLEEELDLIVQHLTSENSEELALANQLFETELLPRLEAKIDGYITTINRKKASLDYRKTEAKRINSYI